MAEWLNAADNFSAAVRTGVLDPLGSDLAPGPELYPRLMRNLARTLGVILTWTCFLLLSAIWGSSFLWIAIALDEGVPPLTLVSLRTLFAGGLLVLVLLARGGRYAELYEMQFGETQLREDLLPGAAPRF
mgnify:CR=1 FL=1